MFPRWAAAHALQSYPAVFCPPDVPLQRQSAGALRTPWEE